MPAKASCFLWRNGSIEVTHVGTQKLIKHSAVDLRRFQEMGFATVFVFRNGVLVRLRSRSLKGHTFASVNCTGVCLSVPTVSCRLVGVPSLLWGYPPMRPAILWAHYMVVWPATSSTRSRRGEGRQDAFREIGEPIPMRWKRFGPLLLELEGMERPWAGLDCSHCVHELLCPIWRSVFVVAPAPRAWHNAPVPTIFQPPGTLRRFIAPGPIPSQAAPAKFPLHCLREAYLSRLGTEVLFSIFRTRCQWLRNRNSSILVMSVLCLRLEDLDQLFRS